jgi:hypothetical protein
LQDPGRRAVPRHGPQAVESPKRKHALAGCQLLQRCRGQHEGDQAGRARRLKAGPASRAESHRDKGRF